MNMDPKYRQLERGEIIQKGDEFFASTGMWMKTQSAGDKVCSGTYRRLKRLDPVWDPQYRKLEVGEIILDTDEVRGTDGVWRSPLRVGMQVITPILYRRKITLEPLNADVFALDVIGKEYRRQMDEHRHLCTEIASTRGRLDRLSADRDTARERANSLMETIVRLGGPRPELPADCE